MGLSKFPTHIALKREEHDRLLALGAKLSESIGAQLSPRQVVLYLLNNEEKRQRRATNKLRS